jgi:hypothetical protein
MEQLFVFTGGGRAAGHYRDTVLRDVSTKDVEKFLSADERRRLSGAFPKGAFRAWGAVLGESNTPNWDRMQVGDVVAAYYEGKLSHVGYVGFKTRNPALARGLWGEDEGGRTWELVYLLSSVTEVNLPVEILGREIGYKANWKPQGFSRVQSERLESLLVKYGSVGAALGALAGGAPVISKIVEEALDLARKTDLSSDADKVEKEAESKAEATYKGRSEETSRALAREVLLRAMALAGSQPQPKKVIGTRYERGPVGVAAKKYWGYRCMVEGCGFSFTKRNGEPYAEAHHLELLAAGGADHPKNIVVLCANHHRMIHFADVTVGERTDEQLILRISGERVVIKHSRLE